MDEIYALNDQDESSVFIQWKGTDVCLDFNCECGWHGHYDGEFAYEVLCPSCETVWELPSSVPVRRTQRGRWTKPVEPWG